MTSTTYAGGISGTGGSIYLNGPGSLTLTGSNTYSGTTIITGGTVQVGNGGITGSIAGTVTNNGSLVFNRSDNLTYAGVISGSGSVTKLGAGTLTLTGNSTHAGATTVSGGTLRVGSGGTSGSLTSDVTNNGSLVFNRSDNLTYAGVISGSGSVTKLGAGTLTLTGNSTHAGATTISAGTLQIGDGGTTGSIAGTVANDGSLIFNRSNNLTYAGAISGAGSLIKQGAGVLTLTGTNAYTGGTTISGGTLRIGDGGTSGSIAGDVVNDGMLEFNRSDDVTYVGAISSSSFRTIRKSGPGTLTLSGNNQNFLGFVEINQGTLVAGSGGALGFINSVSFGGGTLRYSPFNHVDISLFIEPTIAPVSIDTAGENVTYHGDLSLALGGLTKLGSGTLTLQSNPEYQGPTIVNAGKLAVAGNLTTSDFISVTGGTLEISANGNRVIKTQTVSVTGSGKIDVTDNGMIVTADTLSSIRAELLAGSGGAGFAAQTWDQPGIMSSVAASDPLTYGVGYMDNDNFILGPKSDFLGQTVPPASILVRQTLSGDADLDWDVDDDDVTVLGIFYGGAGHWYEADFDYTGVVDDDDVTIIGITYGQTLPGAPGGVSAVPEPASLGLLGVAAGALLLRRRGRTSASSVESRG